MTNPSHLPSHKTLQRVLAAVAPDHHQFSIHPLAGSYSNFTHLVKIEFARNPPRQIVLRRYNPANGHETEKAVREYQALRRLRQHGIPVPPPLLMDADGRLLGSPGILTEFVRGRQIEPPTEAAKWAAQAEATASMLARIHSTPLSKPDRAFLMDDNVEVAWFIKNGQIPAYMQRDPDGPMVWHCVNERLPRRMPVESRFLHTDYWSGNILWQDGVISAVVDWEEAGYGDPAADVAYCRMEYALEGLPAAADLFLRVYEAASGHPLENLPLFELAAAARPMTDPAGWFTRPHMEERFRKFILRAKQALLSAS